MVDLRLMVANLKFIFLICFQQETLADGIVPTNVNVLITTGNNRICESLFVPRTGRERCQKPLRAPHRCRGAVLQGSLARAA